MERKQNINLQLVVVLRWLTRATAWVFFFVKQTYRQRRTYHAIIYHGIEKKNILVLFKGNHQEFWTLTKFLWPMSTWGRELYLSAMESRLMMNIGRLKCGNANWQVQRDEGICWQTNKTIRQFISQYGWGSHIYTMVQDKVPWLIVKVACLDSTLLDAVHADHDVPLSVHTRCEREWFFFF